MPAKKKPKVEVEVEEVEVVAPVIETEAEPEVEEIEENKTEKAVWVAEAEPETAAETPAEAEPDPEPVKPTAPEAAKPHSQPADTSSIFGPTPEETSKGSKKLFWVLIVVFALLGAAAGGVGIYLQNRPSAEPAPSPTPEASALPSPSPETKLNREDISIQVLNGSGVTGAAGKAKDYLEGLGYTVDNVGNANSSDYTQTEISTTTSAQKYVDMLTEDLGSNYTVSDQVGSLGSDSSYDVVIILGSE